MFSILTINACKELFPTSFPFNTPLIFLIYLYFVYCHIYTQRFLTMCVVLVKIYKERNTLSSIICWNLFSIQTLMWNFNTWIYTCNYAINNIFWYFFWIVSRKQSRIHSMLSARRIYQYLSGCFAIYIEECSFPYQ